MKKPIRLHCCILLVFCFWANIHLPLFSDAFLVYGQTEGVDSAQGVGTEEPSSTEGTEIIDTPVLEEVPTTEPTDQYQTPSEEETDTTIYESESSVGEESVEDNLETIPTQIQQAEEIQAPSLEVPKIENETATGEVMLQTGVVLGDELSGTIPEPTDTLPEEDTSTIVLETIYEHPSTGTTTTEWSERITVLSKAELTVIIPEHTTIRNASENKEIAIEQLLLLPEIDADIQTTNERQEPAHIEEKSPLIPEIVTITNQGEVALDPEDYTIPEQVDQVIVQEDVLAEPTLEEIVPEETIPEESLNNLYIYESDTARDDESTPLGSIIPESDTTTSSAYSISEEKEPLQEIFEFGIPGEHLLFSEPVTLSYAVPYPEGSLVEILVQHAGDTSAGVAGLATDNSSTCTPDGSATKGGNLTEVIGGKVTFFTCGASTFNLIYTGGASAPNFVDNGTKNYTGLVLTGVDFPTGSVLRDVDILVNFRPIDNESPTGPWGTTNCYPAEKSFLLIHPDGTQVQLANAGTYTAPTTNCPQAQILYDQSAASGIVGGAWNLTGQSRQPVGSLNTLNGKSPFGLWTLRMGDSTSADGVILFGFDLTLKNIECGDGVISTGEVCDDGNIDNDDGCAASCTVEGGWECTGQPSICTEIPAPSGLRLHYDGSMTGGLFTDKSGSGFNGTNVNGVTTGNQNGETVMCFNGTTQYIERATNLVTAYPFTMSTWMKSDTTAGLHGVVSYARSTSTNRMRNIEHNGTTIRSNGQNTAARYANATTALNTTEWFLVTAVYNSATDRDIYVNGIYEGTSTNNVGYSSNANNRLNIGRLADRSPANYYDGCVDDVRFYSTALTSGQVYTLYAQPAALTTSYTTQSSPLLTGTIDGVLDTITLTISGTLYTGTNNGNGTWTLTGGIISPGLPNGTYPTTLTVTNPYGRAVTYNSSFIVDACGNNVKDTSESCDDGNTNNGDGCSDVCTIESGYNCFGNPSTCELFTCSSGVYFDIDNSGGQSSGDTLFTGGNGLASRTGKFDIGSGETASIVLDFLMYDDGTTIDVNGTHIYHEGQPNFFTPTLNAPRTANVNGLPRLRVTLSNGSVLIQGTLTSTSTSLTTLTPTAGSTAPTFTMGAQNEVVVGITNQGGASGSDFTVSYINSCTPPIAGDYCIASPSSLAFPQVTTESYAQTGFTTSSGYFELIDSSGADSGYYTTLQITHLSGTTTSLSNTGIARQSTGIVLLSGTANTGVTLGSAFTSYSVASGTVTYIKRDSAPNGLKIGTYGAPLQLRIALPAYVKPDTYAGTITYTLYEN